MALATKTAMVNGGDGGGGGGGLNKLMDREGVRLTILLITLTLIITLCTVLLVLSTILIGSFKLDLLTMVSDNFLATPVLMIIASTVSILVAILGFVVIFRKRTNLYIILGVSFLLALVLQVSAVILTFHLRRNIDRDFNKVNVNHELSLAAVENSTERAVWDSLQRNYKCCGGRGSNGYQDWKKHLRDAYPDSCCNLINPYPNCGAQVYRELGNFPTRKIYERIHVNGCVTVILASLENYVMPLLLAWALIALIVVLAQLLLIIFCLCIAHHLRTLSKQGTKLKFETSGTGKLESEPLRHHQQSYTSTLNVNIINNSKQ